MREAADTERSGEFSNWELLRRLWPFFRPYCWHFAGGFCLLLLFSGLMIVGPVLIKRAIDQDIAGKDWAGLQLTVGVYFSVLLLQLVVGYIMRNWLEWTGQNMMAGLRKKLFAHLLKLPLSYHDRQTPGKLMTRVESDTQALRMLFTTTAVVLLGNLVLFAGMFVVMGWISPRLTAVMAVWLPLLLCITLYFQRQTMPIFTEVRRLNSEVAGRLTEFLQAMPVLWAFARRRWALREFLATNKQKFDTNYAGERLIVTWFNLTALMEVLAFSLVLGVGGYWAITYPGLVSIGTLVLFLGYIRRFFGPVLRLSEQLSVIQKAFAAADRIFHLMRQPIVIEEPADPQAWPGLQQGIRFENVWFRYSDEGDWILQDVSFQLPAGTHTALVGPTGAGKTTIVNLLLRFYDPQRGRILVDGVDLRDMHTRELRKHLGMVLQDIYLFPGDLETNLTLGNDYSHDLLEQSARLTLADRFIVRLPGGYAADVSERGANLSMGQRQLLSFTRALVRDPELLILDEATSAVDPATEALLGEATRRALSGRTALIIAHRLSTVRHCEQILVLEHGQVVQQGSHQDLLSEDGLYRSLHELQSTAPIEGAT